MGANLMAVKASGFKLKQITPTTGYVVVDYRKIRDYFNRVDLASGIDYEKDSVDFVKSAIVETEGIKPLRPSVEAGFHSFLKKYVIHSHSVYANIITCSVEGKGIVEAISKETGIAILWIPYINPGFNLTLKIMEQLKKKQAEVIFMENHGLIATNDDADACIALHDRINELIRSKLCVMGAYPVIRLIGTGENTYESKTPFLMDFIRANGVNQDYFEKYSLYPDQLVYLNGNISVDGPKNKLNVDTKAGTIVYETNGDEAMTIEETLLGYFYVIDNIRKCKLTLKVMSEAEIRFIKNWESESYRKSLLKTK
jgi:hypothetical protein